MSGNRSDDHASTARDPILRKACTARRRLLGAMIVSAVTVPRSLAQTGPAQAMRIITPFGAGTYTDALSRAVAQGLSAKWQQPVIVDNRPGAGGIIGTVAVATSMPDGRTLLMGSNGTHAINPSLHAKLPYDAMKDFVPITQVAAGYSLLVVHPSVDAKSVPELIALAKSKPGRMTFGSGGIGTTPHLAGELFKVMAGVSLNHVPYKASTQSMLDLLAGRVDMIFANAPAALPHIKTGKLRVLAVTTPQRVAEFPDLPTISESGAPGFAAEYWIGMFAPAGTPSALVELLSQQIRSDLANDDLKRTYAAQGVIITTSTPKEFAQYVHAELLKWGAVVKASGARAE